MVSPIQVQFAKISITIQDLIHVHGFSSSFRNFVFLTENTLDEGKSPTHTHDTCKELASHLIHFKSLPMECRKFTDVVVDLKRRDSDSTDPTQVLS